MTYYRPFKKYASTQPYTNRFEIARSLLTDYISGINIGHGGLWILLLLPLHALFAVASVAHGVGIVGNFAISRVVVDKIAAADALAAVDQASWLSRVIAHLTRIGGRFQMSSIVGSRHCRLDCANPCGHHSIAVQDHKIFSIDFFLKTANYIVTLIVLIEEYLFFCYRNYELFLFYRLHSIILY